MNSKTAVWTYRTRAITVVISLLVALLLAELGAGIYLGYLANDADFERFASIRQLRARYGTPICCPHRYLGFSLAPNYARGANRHNSTGYRGDEIPMPKPAGEFRILCMGGSTVYGVSYDDYTLSWPYQLKEHLAAKGYRRVRVVNAGAPAWSTWESMIDFELRGIYLSPDLIIINHGVNDVHCRIVWPPEAYLGDGSGRRMPITADVVYENIFEYSVLCRIFMIRAGIILPQNALQRSLDIEPPTYYGDLFDTQGKNHVYPSGLFARVSAMQMLQTNKPIYFEQNIRSILAIASSRHIATVISSFAYSPLFSDEPRASSPEYVFAYHEMNALSRKIAEDTGAHFCDLASVFPVQKDFWTDGRHMSKEGNRLAAEIFADYLIRERLLSL